MAIKNGLALLAAVVMTSYIVVAAAQGTPEQVIMFDNKDFSGGSQDFPVTLPVVGCAPCAELNRIRTNSWESYVSSGGGSIQLFDSHGCGVIPLRKNDVYAGKTSGKIPANQGVIPGTLADSVDSFILCN